MVSTRQARRADRLAVQLAEGEGMLTERAKVSRVTQPESEPGALAERSPMRSVLRVGWAVAAIAVVALLLWRAW